MKMKMIWIAALLAFLPAHPARVYCAQALLDTRTIPPQLAIWKPWVLHGKERRLCPTACNNGEVYECDWPSRLDMSLEAKGGHTTQQWRVFVKEPVELPGGANVWPASAKVDGKPAPVFSRNDLPVVILTPGKHVVEADYVWDEMPGMISIPAASGLVSVSVEGKPLAPSLMDQSGRVWLHGKSAAGRRQDRLDAKIYRLVDDSIPMRVLTRLRIDVSGRGREVGLGKVLLKGAIPVGIRSDLPVKLGASGELIIQARPGHWNMEIATRFAGPVEKIGPVHCAFGREVWSFRARNQLRMVEVEGLPGIDPGQTDLPREWRKFPAYIVQPGATMRLKETRLGDPAPAADALHLRRTWWLDFDGRGFTLQDRIDGTMSRHHYLAMNPPGIPGRVAVDGIDQLITSRGRGKKSGVELRKGEVHLVAESRYEASRASLPAVGWDHDFQSVSGVLNLPPGWRLLTASGVDLMPGTGLRRWTLLDLFIALVISLAVSRLWNYRWGLLALAAVALTYHESGAPRLVWLPLLAATALLGLLPQGRARKSIGAFRLINVVVLLAIAIPFMVRQIRCGIYPQLEMPSGGSSLVANFAPRPYGAVAPPRRNEFAGSFALKQGLPRSRVPAATRAKGRKYVSSYPEEKTALMRNPDALIQTGPGLPAWRWHSIPMEWNGPVARNQKIRLWLLSPAMNLILAFLRVILIALLLLRMIDTKAWGKPVKRSVGTVALLLAFHLAFLPRISRAAENFSAFPPPKLLKQLQDRLLKPNECLPHCADSPYMEISVNGQALQILFQIHAATDTAVPLPGKSGSWMAQNVLLDAHPAESLLRDKEGILWILVPPGVHTVTLEGTPGADSIELPLPLRPHRARFSGTGWDVQGIHPDGGVESTVQLRRRKSPISAEKSRGENRFPPFLHIRRELSLGLDWRVTTTVDRLNQPGTPVVAKIPLLAGESVTTAGVEVADGKALLNMGPGIKEVKWESTLARAPRIRLHASSGDGEVGWNETWVLNASPVWHCELQGIPVVHHQDGAGYWRPRWRPWAGETVEIAVTRPEGIAGQLVTIDNARLELIPGRRLDKASLSLAIRSSQGGTESIHLPPGAQLQQVGIDGKSLPVRQNGGALVLPLRPGAQHVELEWYENRGGFLVTRSPEVGIGDPGQRAVNASVIFRMRPNRWILWTGGPRLGPAVLFWSYLLIVILIAAALGRTGWTPLKTRHWLLLGLGLTQIQPLAAIMIVGWLLALDARERRTPIQGALTFNLSQLLLALWTLAAMAALYLSIEEGLLGIPRMQIAGNGSNDFFLRWMRDRITHTMPRPWVLSVPMIVFRVLMLSWALWLAISLLKWLAWGWRSFGKGGMWRKTGWRRKREARQQG